MAFRGCGDRLAIGDRRQRRLHLEAVTVEDFLEDSAQVQFAHAAQYDLVKSGVVFEHQ